MRGTQSSPERARRVAGREKWSSSSPALMCPVLDCPRCPYSLAALRLLQVLRLALIFSQYSRFNESAYPATQLHGVEPRLLSLPSRTHHPCGTPVAFQNRKTEHSYGSVIT